MSPSLIQTDGAEPLCQIVTPVGMMGYGFSEEQVEAALQEFSRYPTPTAIALDAGSTDSGPSKLALGTTTCPRSSYVRDFRKLLKLGLQYQVPILMSSAAGDGSDEHVDMFLEIIDEISKEPGHESWKLKVLAIYSEVPKTVVLDHLAGGRITGCGASVPGLTAETVEQTPRIVAQMGPEPLMDAIASHPDFNVLVSGRAYDVAPFVAFAASTALKVQGLTGYTDLCPQALGAITHMGKILECGGLCATPKCPGAQGILNSDWSFDVKPLDPRSRCTSLSVAAHTLYEKSRPDILVGPGGFIDLAGSTFTALEDGESVRVRGSIFHSSRQEGSTYTVKLEGARVAGFRTLTMGSFRDPILIPQIDSFLESVKQFAKKQHAHVTETWDIGFHVNGFNQYEPEFVPSQVFVVIEAIAESQDVATSLASACRVHCAHGSYPNQKATSGSFAMGIGGVFELETKQCAEFSVYHLMPLSEGQERARENSLPFTDKNGLFRWKVATIGSGSEYAQIGGLRSKTVSKLQGTGQPPTTAVTQVSCSNPKTLVDVAKVVRSKNSGPFEITLDVMFDNRDVYNAIKDSGLLSNEVIAKLYNLDVSEIVWAGYFDAAMAFKATVPRKRRGQPSCSGGYLEDDVHGSQQYIPLVRLSLPEELTSRLGQLMGGE